MRPRVLIAALATGVLTVAVAHAHPAVVEPPVVDPSFVSHGIKARLKRVVSLPIDYGAEGRRYPVIYFLHGLPALPSAYRGASFVADVLRDRAILVAPQGVHDGDADPESLDWGPGRNWETALGVVPPARLGR